VAVLRRWFSPKSILLHFAVVIVAGGCGWLCDWQYHRAIGGNGLSWAYVFEWPFFGCCAIYLWWDMIHHPEKRAPVMWATSRRVSAAAGSIAGSGSENAHFATALAVGTPGEPAAAPGTLPTTLDALGTFDLGAVPPGVVDAAVLADFPTEEEDPELAAYNRYLAELHAGDRRNRG